MSQPPASRGAMEPVFWLWQAGLRFKGMINAGSADGQMGLALTEHGMLRDAVILDIDAQAEYRPELEQIHAVIGGHWRICALADTDGGEVEIVRGAHEYWASVRPAGDPYWRALNDLRAASVRVPRRTIDSLVAETALPGPYLLLMDVQGAEAAALRGATRTLADTDVICIEAAVEDFDAIHRLVSDAGFDLFDLTHLSYTANGVLGWFYPVYLSRRRRALRPAEFWQPEANAAAVAAQVERRKHVHRLIGESLARRRAGAWPPAPR